MQGVRRDTWRRPDLKGLKAAFLSALGCGQVPGAFLLGSFASGASAGGGAVFKQEPRGLRISSSLANAEVKGEQSSASACSDVGW